ncbi:MAG: hypothetical protein KGZ83_10290 [Sulfuricella sp.]|nr:hypothetical protein [Sulfuricella sp.]
MTPTQADFCHLLDTLVGSVSARDAAIADNYRFEERVSETRQAEYEAKLGAPNDIQDWREYHDGDHVANRIKAGGEQFIPETFLEANRPLLIDGVSGREMLIRVEDLRFPINNGLATLDLLADWVAGRTQPDQAKTLATFIDGWNKSRANWPMFSAFLGDVSDDAEHTDWPHRLRDRLGLDHYQGSARQRIPVALMRYPAKLALDKAKKDARIAAAFALPCALDGDFNPAFFPAPAGQRYGAALNLAEPWQPTLSAEILNLRIDYQPEHLWKIGEIVRPAGYRDLRRQRDQHLDLLRRESGNRAYGEPLTGRP